MARPNQESIDMFIRITGLPNTLANQILQGVGLVLLKDGFWEYGGDLSRAVNAHFNHGHRAIARGASVVAPQYDSMDVDEPVQADPDFPKAVPTATEGGEEAYLHDKRIKLAEDYIFQMNKSTFKDMFAPYNNVTESSQELKKHLDKYI